MSHVEHERRAPDRVACHLITVSDTRTPSTDEGGDLIRDLLREADHRVVGRDLVPDEVDAIRGALEEALAADGTDALLLTGGTGISPRDVTPEAVRPLLERRIPGFGEMFRFVSFQEIGSAAMLSRAFAGVREGVPIVALPGSTNAIRTALDLLLPQLPHLVHHARGDG